MSWCLEPQTCPGVFYGTTAQDGTLLRLRVPGGCLYPAQVQALVDLGQQYALETLQVTNRANLQLRAVATAPTAPMLRQLQHQGLAAQDPRLDHLRNIMASPTAGIDPQELLNTRPWCKALDTWIQRSLHLVGLPAKFSIGLDGGGTVAIGTRAPQAWVHRYNEIQLSVVQVSEFEGLPPGTHWQLALGGDRQLFPTPVLIAIEDCVTAVAALSQVYRDYVAQNPLPTGKKPRLKHLLQDWGIERYLERVEGHLPRPWLRHQPPMPRPAQTDGHLGVHSQRQAGQVYVGVALPLGQLTLTQLQGLAHIAQRWGPGELRLTPWQGILIPHIPEAQVSQVLAALTAMGLSTPAAHERALVACTGKPGCGAAATHTQIHARALLQTLNTQLALDTPVNIHLSACPKGCAQPSPAELTLLGTENIAGEDCYHLYLGAPEGEPLYAAIPATQLPAQVLNLLRVYQQHRTSPQESFGEFAQGFQDWPLALSDATDTWLAPVAHA
ncbi:precorrin-3B synthase [Synechococcales cyanobacterium C]|uniref:Precorrin-3B synthase n=1 Tax=Petrachloros mirabilis ULC683 TaxID=2781853 RepID=A0A8K2A6A5_9CYAN|nr:precorrin-3B synthase [Petrachloros mirabilis]NCJ05095.1 precorrin-3B synthase [Petrachloros mirabilis ULC683]